MKQHLDPKRKYAFSEFVKKMEKLPASEIPILFEAFFTPQEIEMLLTRYLLIKRLVAGETQRSIASDLGISIAQVTRGSKELKYGKGAEIFEKFVNL